MKGWLLDADYVESEGRAAVRLFLSGGAVSSHVQKACFYVEPKGPAKKARDSMDRLLKGNDEVSYDGAEVVKRKIGDREAEVVRVCARLPTDIMKMRDIIKKAGLAEHTYEYSINFYRKFLIDNDLDGAGMVSVESGKIRKADRLPEFKRLAVDTTGMEEAGVQKISSISIETGSRSYLIGKKDERRIIEEFVSIIKKEDPDVIFTYTGDQIGFSLLDARSKALKIKLDIGRDGSKVKFERRAQFSTARIKGRAHIDLYSFIVNTLGRELQTETMDLNSVAAEILKDEGAGSGTKTVLRLGDNLLPQICALSNLIGQTIFDTSRMHYGQMAEWYLMRRAVREGRVIPNPPIWDEISARQGRPSYEGGYVREPIPGLHENVAVLDFRSLYPSIIASFNISPETLNHKKCKGYHDVPGTKYKFCKERPGFVSSVIKDVILKRNELKGKMKSSPAESLKNQIQAFKITANAMYGMFGFAGARWYSRECADASATLGRHFIKSVIESAEKEGFTVIYSDTDSIFIERKGAKTETDRFLRRINESLPGMMELDLQGLYKRGIFIPKGVGGAAKKRYALIGEGGDLVIRGLERVRKDWSRIAKETQEEVLRLVLDKRDVDGAVKHVQDVIGRIRSGKAPLEDFIIYERLSKPLSEYKQIGPHVTAARKLKGEVGMGSTVRYVITKGSGSISERAVPAELAKRSDVDASYYISNQVLPAALRILQVFGITEEKILKSGLSRFVRERK